MITIACAAAKPELLGAALAYTGPLAYSAPLDYSALAAVVTAPTPPVTATSIARNNNGIDAASEIASVAAPVVAKYAAASLAYPSRLANSAPISCASAAAQVII